MRRPLLPAHPHASPHVFAVTACVLLTIFARSARADDLLGAYIGGAAGQARVAATAPFVGTFGENHPAFKVMAGIRPIPLVGAELAYLDFGHPSHSNGFISTDVTMKGAAALGVLYVPLKMVDIYAKAGVARLQSTVHTSLTCPPGYFCIDLASPAPVSRTNVGFASGAGAQLKMGAFAVRGEYERFNAAGEHPGMWSVGVTWAFL